MFSFFVLKIIIFEICFYLIILDFFNFQKLTREANKKVKKVVEPYNQVLRDSGYYVPALV